MDSRIRRVTVKPIRLTPTEAELVVEVHCASPQPTTDLGGRLMGPTCAYSTTVEVAYPIRMLPRGTGDPSVLRGRVVIPEPGWWDPQSPFLYYGPVVLWDQGQKVDETTIRCGLRSAKLTPAGIWWNGHSLDVRPRPGLSLTEAEWAEARQEGFNAVLVPVEAAEAAWTYADRVGLLVITDGPCPVDPVQHPSALGSESGGELHIA